jgi:cobalt/nickel transport system permease protein
MLADGGLMVLGANVFNMGIVSVCGGYFVFRLAKRLIRGDENRATVFAAAFAAWFGTVLAAIACAGQLALAKTVAWSVAFPAMAGIHMLIGVGEGLVTALVVMAVLRTRPELVTGARGTGSTSGLGFVGYSLLLALGLAVFVAPFACPWPDGLEVVARSLGFEGRAAGPALQAPFAGYHIPFFGSATVATAVAGVIGTVLAFIAAYALARVLVPVLSSSKKNAAPGN